MQVEFKQINAAKKEVIVTIEADKVMIGYNKFLSKSAKEVSVPGFRPGKAPLSMVERNYGEKIRDYFLKDYVDEAFTAAAQEHDINFLLYPEIKDVQWEKGNPMVILVEIEVEPEIFFTQIEGLTVPYKPLDLQDEIQKYVEDLRKENSTLIDVEDEITAGDEVEFEVTATLGAEIVTKVQVIQLNEQHEPEITAAAIGKKIGDTFEVTLPHALAHYIFPDAEHTNHEDDVPAGFMVNAIRRTVFPVLDDEFAKDLEFDSLDDMYAKIETELAAKNELKNLNLKINALITKLYIDNRFDLPQNVIQYLVEKELEGQKIPDEQWRKYYEFQIRYQMTQEFINVYLMKALRKEYQIELTEDDYTAYYNHEAGLADQSVEEWKAKHAKDIEDESFAETVQSFTILIKIAATCTFVIQEDSPADSFPAGEEIVAQSSDAETVEQD